MGCFNGKATKSYTARIAYMRSVQYKKIEQHYKDREPFLPSRIKELFLNYFSDLTSEITTIDLKFIHFSTDILESVTMILPAYTSIQLLNLWKTRLKNEGCIALSGFIHNFTQLQQLSLADNEIGVTGLIALCPKLTLLKNLEILGLHINLFDKEMTRVLVVTVPLIEKLRIIFLDECEIKGEGLKELLNAFGECKFLERISIDYNYFGDELGNELLKVLSRCDKLIRISAQQCGISYSLQDAIKEAYPKILFSF